MLVLSGCVRSSRRDARSRWEGSIFDLLGRAQRKRYGDLKHHTVTALLFQLWWLSERNAVDLDVESSGPFGNNYEDARWELIGEVAAVHLVGGPEHVGA